MENLTTTELNTLVTEKKDVVLQKLKTLNELTQAKKDLVSGYNEKIKRLKVEIESELEVLKKAETELNNG